MVVFNVSHQTWYHNDSIFVYFFWLIFGKLTVDKRYLRAVSCIFSARILDVLENNLHF